MAKVVIDLSKFNIIDDYNAVAKSIDGVIVRCGYRGLSNGKLTEDPSYATHITNLIRAGVKVGVYFFTTAINTNEAAEEAAFTCSLLKKYNVPVSFPIFVDSEMSNNSHTGRSDSLPKSTRTEILVTFCEKIQVFGYTAGIYASDSWFVSQLNLSQLTKYKLWVAKYSSNSPKYVKDYVGWQYTSSGVISGVRGRVDISHWYNEISNTQPNISPNGNPYVEPTSNIKKGMKGEGVLWLQYELCKVGYEIAIDGDFGNNTYKALVEYQTSRGLTPDGILGSITRNSFKTNKEKVKNKTIKLESGAGPVELNNTSLYSNSKTSKETRKISGNYFIWNDKVVNDRIRICKAKEDANKLTRVVGWINYKVISKYFE